jgi:hypothetical protein
LHRDLKVTKGNHLRMSLLRIGCAKSGCHSNYIIPVKIPLPQFLSVNPPPYAPRLDKIALHSTPLAQPIMPATIISNATRIWELNVHWSAYSQCGIWNAKGRGVDIWECIRDRKSLTLLPLLLTTLTFFFFVDDSTPGSEVR